MKTPTTGLTARQSYYKILEYLEDKWTVKELGSFIARAEEVLSHICQNPLLYPCSKESDTHKSVIVKQVSLFYRVKPQEVELLVFWNNHQDLAKLLF